MGPNSVSHVVNGRIFWTSDHSAMYTGRASLQKPCLEPIVTGSINHCPDCANSMTSCYLVAASYIEIDSHLFLLLKRSSVTATAACSTVAEAASLVFRETACLRLTEAASLSITKTTPTTGAPTTASCLAKAAARLVIVLAPWILATCAHTRWWLVRFSVLGARCIRY